MMSDYRQQTFSMGTTRKLKKWRSKARNSRMAKSTEAVAEVELLLVVWLYGEARVDNRCESFAPGGHSRASEVGR